MLTDLLPAATVTSTTSETIWPNHGPKVTVMFVKANDTVGSQTV
jgi:hypothetical protein